MASVTLNVRVTGALGDHVAASVGHNGLYENVSEYVRDLIRRDHARTEAERLEILRQELQHAFAVPESDARPFDAEAFRQRMRERHG